MGRGCDTISYPNLDFELEYDLRSWIRCGLEARAISTRLHKGAVVVCDSKGGCSRLSGHVEVWCNVMWYCCRVVSVENGFLYVCEQNSAMDWRLLSADFICPLAFSLWSVCTILLLFCRKRLKFIYWTHFSTSANSYTTPVRQHFLLAALRCSTSYHLWRGKGEGLREERRRRVEETGRVAAGWCSRNIC